MRYWQHYLVNGATRFGPGSAFYDIANAHGYQLSPEDIDELCESLNFGAVRLVHANAAKAAPELLAALINLSVLSEIGPEPRGKVIEFQAACTAARAAIAKATK